MRYGLQLLEYQKRVHDGLYKFKGTPYWDEIQQQDVESVHKFREQLASLDGSNPEDVALLDPIWNRMKDQFKPQEQAKVKEGIFWLFKSLATLHYGDTSQLIQIYKDSHKHQATLGLLARKAGVKEPVTIEDMAEFLVGNEKFKGLRGITKEDAQVIIGRGFYYNLLDCLEEMLNQPNVNENPIAKICNYFQLASMDTQQVLVETIENFISKRLTELEDAEMAIGLAYVREAGAKLVVKPVNDSEAWASVYFDVWEHFYVDKEVFNRDTASNLEYDRFYRITPGKETGTGTIKAYIYGRFIAEERLTLKRKLTPDYYKPTNGDWEHTFYFNLKATWEDGPAGPADKYLFSYYGRGATVAGREEVQYLPYQYHSFEFPKADFRFIEVRSVYGDFVSEPMIIRGNLP
ncbi:hypothetical protein SY83_07625 [Paenibacillus swuensis]|uniref:Uncharacterized protein n=2 Tax=Paenibacillus swuensis TaxID=1178515 RepID=A0A172TGI0_9BACL|nr:hypothetical protein SY83_07625 [Paenibacillus swuensis]